MKKTLTKTIGALAVAALSTVSAFAQTTGFNQTAAGPYDYNTTGNWVGNTINGIWDSSLTLSAAQTATFAADTTLTTGLTFNYAGNFGLTLDSSSTTAQLLTLGGDIGLATGGGTTANVTIGNAANQLNVDLGSVNRTIMVAASRTLTIVNAISSASGSYGITNVGAGKLVLSGANTFSGGLTINSGTLQIGTSGVKNGSELGSGTVTLNAGTLAFTSSGNTTVINYAPSFVLNGGTVSSSDGIDHLGTGVGATINVTGATTLQRTWGHITGKFLALDGILQGSSALTLQAPSASGANNEGSSIWINNANNTYSGTITVNAGTGKGGFAMVDGANNALQFATINLSGTRTGTSTDAALLYGVQFATGVTAPVFAGLSGSGNIALQDLASSAAALTVNGSVSPAAFSGILSGAGSLTKAGSGTLTLSGANTYTGDTTISAGTLAIGGSGKLGGGSYSGAIINNGSLTYGSSAAQTLSGPMSGSGNLTVTAGTLNFANSQSFSLNTVSVNDGAALIETYLPSVQMTATNLTLGVTTGATLGFVVNSTNLARISAGTLTLNGANTIKIIGGNLATGSSYPLIAYTTLAGSGTYALAAGVGGNLSTSNNTIYFNATGVTNTIWTGAVNGKWDINTTANWTNAGTLGNTYIDGSLVQFDDTGLNTTTISNSVATMLSPFSVLVTNNTLNYCFKTNTIIAGITSLTKTGTANLTNSTPNTYTGSTIINQGQLVAGVASVANTSGALGNNSAVTLANDSTAILNLNGFATQIGSLAGGGLTGGNVTLGSATLTLGADNTSTTYAGIVSGTGGLTKIGTGTLILTGTNNYSGTTTIQTGTVRVTGKNTFTAGNFGLYNVGTVANQTGVLEVIGGTVNANKNSNPSIQVGAAANASGFIKLSSGTLTSVSETHIGNGNGAYVALTMDAGSVLTSGSYLVVGFNNDRAVFNQLGGTTTVSANATTIGDGGTGSIGIANMSGGTFTCGGGIFVGTLGVGILNVSGNASLSLAGNGLKLGTTANQSGWNGTVNLLGGAITANKVSKGPGSGTATFNFNGGTLKSSAANATFMTGLDAAYVYNGGAVIDDGGFAITIPQTLLAPSGYGVASIPVASGGSNYIDTPVVTITNISASGSGATAVANVSGGVVTSITITSPGQGYGSGDTLGVTIFGGGGAGAAAGSPVLGDNTISPGGLTKLGAGTLTMSGALSYAGPTKVLGGTLVLNVGTGLPNPGGDLVVSNATLNLDASSGTMAANNISVGSTLNLILNPSANAINGTGNLTVGDNATNNLVYGTVSSAPSAAIKVTGTLAKGTNIVFNVSATGFQPGWIVPLIEADSTAMTTNGFALGTLPPGIKAVLTNSTANTLDLLVTSAGQLLTWHGSEDGINPAINWDIATSTNWYLLPSFAPGKYQQYLGNTIGDNVTFGDNALYTDGTNHVNVPTAVVPATVVFSASTPYELHGAGGIAGATSVALTNNYAAVYLNTSNSYTGGTIISGGALVITNDNALGAASGGLTLGGGALQLNAPITNSRAVTVTANSAIGVVTNATVQLTGTLSGTGGLTKTDDGTLTLSGNNTYSGATTVSSGTLNLTGSGTNTIVTVGTVGGNALLNLSANLKANSLLVGNAGSAAVNQTAGNVTINGGGGDCMSVGNIAGAFGYYNAQSGTLTANGLAVGGENNTGSGFSGTGGDGIMEIKGATVNDIGWLVMARGATAETGILNIFSGSLAYSGGGLQCNWGAGQTSIINIMGGTVSSTNTPVNFRIAGNTGILNLKGGLLQPSAITGYGILNFNGGTLKSIANNSSFVSAISASVYSGGAIIDDGGYAITINPPLLAPAGYGVSGISLSDGGSGYIAPPIVTISGGTGSNATAIATISGGSVTGITVTSPGNGYDSSDALSVGFSGGGAGVTQPTVSAVNLAANVSGSLTKLGNGTLTLPGANTYTGNTVINAGKLIVTSAHLATNAVSVADTATYGVTLTGAPATVTNKAITLAAGTTTLSFGLGNNGNPGQPLLFCGALTNNGTLNVSVAANSSLLTVGSAIPLMHYAGGIVGSLNPTIAGPRGSSMTLSNDPTGQTLYAVVNSTIIGGIVWTGTNSAPGLTNLWDLNSTTNWLIAGSPTTYQETVPPGDAVTFNDLGSGTVLLSNSASPASVTISNSAVNYTFQGTGSISGSAGLTKQGSGTLTLNTANTYSGGTTLSNGTLIVGNNSSVGSGLVTLAGGTFRNGATVTMNNAISVATSTTTIWDVQGGNFTFNGNLTGGGTITRGIGATLTLWLGGDNSGFTGTYQDQVNANSVTRFTSASAGSANARWIWNQGTSTRMTLNFGDGTINWGSMTGTGFVQQGAAGTSIIQAGALGLNDTFSGVMQQFAAGDVLGLTKVGTGTMTLSGANTYTGLTTVSNGTLVITTAHAGNGDFVVNDNKTLGVVNKGGSQTALLGNLTLGDNAGSSKLFFTNVASATIPVITVASTVTQNGTCNIAISNSVVNTGVYPLIKYGSLAGAGSFALSVPSGVTATLTNDISNSWIALNVSVGNNVNTNPTNMTSVVNGNNLELSWPADHIGWRLQVQTNSLSTGLGTNWVDVPNTSTVNSYTNVINAANGSVFYRMVYP